MARNKYYRYREELRNWHLSPTHKDCIGVYVQARSLPFCMIRWQMANGNTDLMKANLRDLELCEAGPYVVIGDGKEFGIDYQNFEEAVAAMKSYKASFPNIEYKVLPKARWAEITIC